MGGSLHKLRFPGSLQRQNAIEACDLSEEQIEEIRMITSLPVDEIQRIRKSYLELTKAEEMTKEEFLAIPVIALNPLKDRLLGTLELSSNQTIPFVEFANLLAIFSFHSTREVKLKTAFKIHDFDGDGKISRNDLRQYLALVVDLDALVDDKTDTKVASETDQAKENDMAKLQQERLDAIVARVLEEASSDPSQEFLHFDDFVKIAQSSDFETRCLIPF